jgi:thioredoxin 1
LPDLSTRQEFVDAIDESGKVVVLFTAPSWCIPCQRFEPHWERAASEEKDIKFFRVDIDNNEWATVDYDVMRVPTCHLYEDGQFVRDIKVPQGALPFLNDIRS